MSRLLLPRLLLLACLAAAAWIGLAPAARAHGGNFRSDGPQGAEEIDTPVMPGSVRGKTPTTERATWTTGTWHTWWRLNNGAYLPDKREVRRRRTGTARSSIFQLGESSVDMTRWDREVLEGARRTVVPFLLRIVDPASAQPEPIVAAALLALGRTARDAAVIPILERYALRDDLTTEVREAAVLGLGLLRRSERKDQLDEASLRRVRAFCLHLFDDKDLPTRLRAFGVYAVGFLADQPYPDTPIDRDGRCVTRSLWLRLERKYASSDLPVALLVALGMQPRAGIPTGVEMGLRAIASGKPFRRKKWDGILRSHALTAYVRLDGPAWLHAVLWSLRGTSDHVAVRSAAAIALARRAGDLDAADRAEAARTLRRKLPREAHWLARGLGQIALAALLRADLAAGASTLADDLGVDRYLREAALKGRTMTRPYAALALGLSIHGIEPDSKTCAVCIKANRETLLEGLLKGRGSDDVLGAYAVGLGLAGAENAHADLLKILKDRHRGATLRGHCAVALAQLGRDTPALREALTAASQERVSPSVHTGSVKALALLASEETTKQLLDQFVQTRARYSVAVVAGALGRFGDPAAADALIRRAEDRKEALEIRTMSVVALGLIFDPEPRPSRILMTTHANYPARTPALTQVFNIM